MDDRKIHLITCALEALCLEYDCKLFSTEGDLVIVDAHGETDKDRLLAPVYSGHYERFDVFERSPV